MYNINSLKKKLYAKLYIKQFVLINYNIINK